MDYFSAMRAFRYAAELGSFSQAAAKLGVKTSTVSRSVRDLEQDLAIALFNRSTRGLVLTEGGRVFYEQTLQVLQSLEEARAVTAALNSSPRGLLRVTMPTAFGRRHIIRHLPEFLERFPKIDVDAVMTDEVLKIIDSGIDLAIRIGALPDSQLMARRLAPHRRVVCASPRYVARTGTPSSPEDLSTHVTLRFPLAADDRWIFVDRTARAEASQLTVRLGGRIRADDTEALLDLAIAGCGAALLPTWAIGDAVRNGQLVRLLPEWEVQPTAATPAIWAVYPPKKTVSTKVRAFIDFYAELFSKEDYWDL
ncbi:DNA-binding transcriptional LysR family regulator [Paraburkholderia bannensis]|uniref:DNA-binding transcriptional LysR family regulator n=1 Tax=Paraburkholderia bannensis TaxID=765414 RepID=A0A7W9WUQ7_9BURK|nr:MULTISPECIES: LysR family transcriptional regulator [Paraburkholderia]MBB3259038.1 DNA-binding transcriptional LysR family regulator [Paraburkholderia sp. WP4_3_2]MBB6104053.1 DNA-binding transcriptional LysR family regulator [Paraburkholderia bannensis]